MSLGAYAEGFASWRQILGDMAEEDRFSGLASAGHEVARFILRGLDQVEATDALAALAVEYGLDEQDPDRVQAILARTVEEADELRVKATDEAEPYPNGNGHDPEPDAGLAETPLLFPFPTKGENILMRPWIVPGLLLRQQVTVLVAPPGSGKSLLTLQLGMICCAGVKEWSGWRPRGRARVLVINAEEDFDEMRRRLYAAKVEMEIDDELLRESFAIAVERDDLVIARTDTKAKKMARTPMLERIITTIIARKFDIVIVDPFAETFDGDENSNSELKGVGMLWREVARRTNAAVLLVHHTKKYAHDMAGDMDALRGASALQGIARIICTLFTMTSAEYQRFAPPLERVRYLRFDDAKANQNLITTKARWFFKKTFVLPNGSDTQPADEVGVLQPWEPPDVSLSYDQTIEILDELQIGLRDGNGKPIGDPYTLWKTSKSQDRWAGKLIREIKQDWEDKEIVAQLEKWKRGKFLEEFEAPTSTSKGKPRKGVRVIGRPGITEHVEL